MKNRHIAVVSTTLTHQIGIRCLHCQSVLSIVIPSEVPNLMAVIDAFAGLHQYCQSPEANQERSP